MSSVEELPNILNKLAIDGTTKASKNISLDRNPFFNEGINNDIFSKIKNVKNPSCFMCRMRRRSESCLEDYKDESSQTISLMESLQTLKFTPRQKHNVRKITHSSSKMKKIVFREPFSKSLHICNQNSNFLYMKNGLDNLDTNKLSCSSDIALENNVKETDKCKILSGLQISTCSTINFRTMRDIALNKASNCEKKLRQQTPLCLENSIAHRSITCSQQANNSSVTTDDVTIDELASYFDTFVHIPKKMSSMAEMMYI